MKPYFESKLGQLYNAPFQDITKEIPDESIDCICVDPPFGIDFLTGRTEHQEKIENDGFDVWLQEYPKWIIEFKRLLTPTGVLIMFLGGGGAKYPVTAIGTIELIKHMHLIHTLVWYKNVFGIGYRYRPQYENILIASKSIDKFNFYDNSKALSNVLKFNKVVPQKGDHPTQKPVDLTKHLLNIHSQEGQTVADFFAGGGASIVAAEQLNRKWIGCEIKTEYADICKKRIKLISEQNKLFL